MLNHAWIETHIPHQGDICLLERVIEWDAGQIRCGTHTHLSPRNPLRSQHGLGIACGIEYAAQAMALHGALTAEPTQRTPQVGFLASVRDVRFYTSRLDHVESELICEAKLVTSNAQTALYEFLLKADERCLLKGRAAVMLDAGAFKR